MMISENERLSIETNNENKSITIQDNKNALFPENEKLSIETINENKDKKNILIPENEKLSIKTNNENKDKKTKLIPENEKLSNETNNENKVIETLLTIGDKFSIEINKEVEVKESKRIEEIFNYCLPKDNYSGVIDIETCNNNLKKTDYNDNIEIQQIIEKLEKFHKHESINLRIFSQIKNGQYCPIPSNFLQKFKELNDKFEEIDSEKTGCISKSDFDNAIQQIISNKNVVKILLESLSDMNNVYYEAWLLKKRENIYKFIGNL
ncbi:probable polyketide synthase 38 [Daktulosphaira vitifoliae]|uniref:probable polyketide synthase 38 n=1 Tax=Daktulosphaira vitifoliae TaxID=58002 RepID=UPI0021AAADEE|nr:probable polyketide synthase 38 [Daktulosphaira vitifoliae]